MPSFDLSPHQIDDVAPDSGKGRLGNVEDPHSQYRTVEPDGPIDSMRRQPLPVTGDGPTRPLSVNQLLANGTLPDDVTRTCAPVR